VKLQTIVDLTWRCVVLVLKPTVPTLTHVIPKGNGHVTGVTSLNNQLFVTRFYAQEQIEVYNATTFTFQRNISVPGLNRTYGLASCAVNNCLYVTECNSNLVYRVGLLSSSNIVMQWRVGQRPFGISTNSKSNVLVTCHKGNSVQEYTTYGTLICDTSLLSAGTGCPFNAVELSAGQLAINYDDGVCVVDINGVLVRNHTNTMGALVQFCCPRGFAQAQSGCTLLANRGANQLVLFDPSFTYSRVLSFPSDCDALRGPWSLFLDESHGRLYVGEWDGRRVLIFDNVFNVGTDFQ